MPSFVDRTGQRFGRWTVTKRGPNQGKQVTWVCRCECGTVRTVVGGRLASGRSASCGCLHKEIQRERITGNNIRASHGKTKTREFLIWGGVLGRCYNENHAAYRHYGGRGISVCQRWIDKFENFLKDMGISPPKYTIDRIDNDGNYEPDNCRWASRKEQANNRSSSRFITAFGQTKTITQWAEELGTKDPTIRARIKMGWTEEDAVSKPVKKLRRKHEQSKTMVSQKTSREVLGNP